MKIVSIGSKFSRLSNFASGLCLVHCIAFPVLVGILPVIGMSFLLTGQAERIIIWIAIAFSMAGMCWGYRSHRKLSYLALTVLLVFMSCCYFYEAVGSRQHLAYMLLGGLMLAMGNIINRKLCSNCNRCKDHEHEKTT